MVTVTTDTNARTDSAPSAFGRLKLYLVAIFLTVGALYSGVLGYIYFNQQALVFKPDGELPKPSEVGLADMEVVSLPMADGTLLTAWSAPAAREGAPTVLFFHGQSGNLSDRSDRLREILNSGFGLFAPSYRGFPGSAGEPSEKALIADAILMYDRLKADGASIILHGQSLGTGIAAAVAAERPNARMLVLEAPYTATVDIAAERYPFLPVSALMKDQFRTRDLIADIRIPILIFHGTLDETIPVAHGQALAALAGETVQLFVIPGGTHNDLWSHGLWDEVQTALSR